VGREVERRPGEAIEAREEGGKGRKWRKGEESGGRRRKGRKKQWKVRNGEEGEEGGGRGRKREWKGRRGEEGREGTYFGIRARHGLQNFARNFVHVIFFFGFPAKFPKHDFVLRVGEIH
jgi:hypothetical protein